MKTWIKLFIKDLAVVLLAVAIAAGLSYLLSGYRWMPIGNLIPVLLAAVAAMIWFAYVRKREVFKIILASSRGDEPTPYSWKLLQILYECSPDAMYLHDTRGRFIDGNKAALRLTGYRREELLGKSFLKLHLIDSSQRTKAEKLLALNVMGTATGPDEYLLWKKNGETVAVEVETYPIRIGTEMLILGVARDITEHKRIEEELHASREGFHNLVERSADGIIVVDTSGSVRFMNQRAEKYLQRPHNEAIGHELGIPLSAGLRKEISITRTNGKTGTAELRVGDTKWEGQQAFLVTLPDITDRKYAEMELKNIQQTLFQAEKMSALGQMASGLAHEVKNPLDIIVQGVDYIKGSLPPDAEQQHDVIMRVKRAITRADRIVCHLLDFARKKPISRKLHDINNIITTAFEMAVRQCSAADISTSFELVENLPGVMIDAHQMEQVFINIFSNALKAMGGRGSLHVQTQAVDLRDVGGCVGRRTTDRFKPGDRAVKCEIKDSGGGIPPDIIEKIFDPFFTTSPPGEGTGLGLAITRSLVELNGGHVYAQNEDGKGTLLVVLLPTVEAHAHE